MKIEYEKEAAKHISRMDKPSKQRIKTAIEKLPSGDVIKLQGLTDDYRLRVGDLRVLFSVQNETIIIKDVLPRGQAYKRL
ncbi:MAG: type II toxin-antitoxin system RelE/ParE family toxin [Butyrivibrio sp.]|nr:type II toxin-antitoxin system RelE/ParE family toxin [Acetatifactor muris]MCM1561219.1 type II toxin-antitoxin system RelE/ParE family toxin [Butyrivibrio sp.]